MDFTLEPAELAFLLTMVDAGAIPGVELDRLFPDDAAARDAILRQGAASLAAHGHMTVEGRHFRDMNPALPLAAAVLAAPDGIIHTTAYADGDERHAAHYLSPEMVVEFYILPDGNFRLVALDGAATAIGRIAYNLGLDTGDARSAWTHVIPSERLGGQSDLLPVVAAAVRESGSEPTVSQAVAAALAQPRRLAEIDLVRTVAGEIIMRHSVLLFVVSGSAGMLYYDPTGSTTVTVPAAATFVTQLQNGVLALQALSPTPVP